jgi:AraC-like DNA-binding protein
MESKHGQHFHVTIPLPWFLNWQLPVNFVRSILSGDVLIEPDPGVSTKDEHLVELWCQNLANENALLHNAVLFELQARLLRLACGLNTKTDSSSAGTSTSDIQMEKVAIMAKFVAEHGHENIDIADIAKTADLHPNYATTLFHEICGVSLVKFLITHRITLAQILLASTARKIVTIAFECGFNSMSQFYSQFQKLNGITPSQYRYDLKHKNLSHLARHGESQ